MGMTNQGRTHRVIPILEAALCVCIIVNIRKIFAVLLFRLQCDT